MSSAILYVAIVAIWAGVLIPRWLRRDSSSAEQADDDLTTTEPDQAVHEEPAPRPRRDEPAPVVRADTRPEAPRHEARRREAAGREVPPGGPREEERKRMLTARRRLLWMLLALAIGSGALAITKMAAWWVIVPPSLMLLGYTALLREAAKADADRRARPAAAASAAVPASASAAAPAAATARSAAPPAARPAAPAAPPAPVPSAEVIRISASAGQAGEEFYDQYADAKLRAVGDLPAPWRDEPPYSITVVSAASRAYALTPVSNQAENRSGYRGGFGLRGDFCAP